MILTTGQAKALKEAEAEQALTAERDSRWRFGAVACPTCGTVVVRRRNGQLTGHARPVVVMPHGDPGWRPCPGPELEVEAKPWLRDDA